MSVPVGEQVALGEPAKATPVEPAAPASRLWSGAIPAWLQAAPFAAVFMVFFLIPLGLTVMVSFWDYNEYQILPAFTARSYVETFEGCFDKLPELSGLPSALAAVEEELADMIAHHSQGEPVERDKMMHLCQVCGLSANALRDVLFDLPRPGGSRRRRADPSPLSGRETEVLRALAQGKVYKDIGAELGLAASTVRSHLHNIYITLAVSDRAQAVLRATEMGWL